MDIILKVNSVNPESDWTVNSKKNDHIVAMHADTGSKCNVGSQNVLLRLKFKKTNNSTEAILKKFQWTYHAMNRIIYTTMHISTRNI